MTGLPAPSPLLGCPGRASPPAEVRAWTVDAGVEEFPFLADHRLRTVPVLPGAAVVDMALAATAATGRPSRTLHDVRLGQVCVIPASGSRRLRLALRAGLDGALTLVLTSGPGAGAGAASGRLSTTHATARIDALAGPFTRPIDVTERALTVRRTGAESSGEVFYSSLREAGNDYGPAFRTLRRIWRSSNEACALVHIGDPVGDDGPPWLTRLRLVDAAIQLVAAAAGVTGRPFVWAGCERLRVHDTLRADAHGYAWLRPTTGADEPAGDVVLLDSTGRAAAEITGVRLHLVRPRVSRAVSEPAAPARTRRTLAVAATFDAEPLRAELSGRMAALGTTVVYDHHAGSVTQLTSPGRLLASNRDGVNLLLVRPDEVHAGNGQASGNRFTLPGVGDIAQLHSYETEYLYDEIFVRGAYLRHGISLQPGDTIFDVGANIGMFTLFVQHRFPGVRVYAFEPAKPAFEALRYNASQYCPDSKVFNYGISDGDRIMPFTFYRNSTVFSGFTADPDRDAKNIRTVVENALHAQVPSGTVDLRPIVARLLRDRLVADVHLCATKTLSTVLRETDVHRVDLLKIDTEGSEIQVLNGIEDRHWERIRQVVLEVHGQADQRDLVTALLADRGFHVVVDQQEHLLRGTTLSAVVARRPDDRSGPAPEPHDDARVVSPSVRRATHLVQAVAALQRSTDTPCIVCLCPSPSADTADRERRDHEVATALAAVPGVVIVTEVDIEQSRREIGSGPSDLFAGLATIVARVYLDLR